MRKTVTLFGMLLCLILMSVSNVSALTNINGNVAGDTTWGPTSPNFPQDTEYRMQGTVFVQTSATLTIQPGVTIYGDETTLGTLVVERGAKIHAVGTQAQPIVFTTSRVIDGGALDRGLWGGIMIAGEAPINPPGGVSDIEGITGTYGGSNPSDNSGEIQYVRIEYAGHLFTPTVELNGISFFGVGNGTTVDHVQVHMNKDDCIEMYGGTVNMKYMIGTWCRDDSFDWTEGWTGKAQFVVASQRADEADRGIEADNNSNDFEAIPRSHPVIYNMTLVGDPYPTYGIESTQGMILRVGTAAEIRNVIVTGFKSVGIRVDDASTEAQGIAGALDIENAIICGNNNGGAQYTTRAQNLVTGGYWTNHYACAQNNLPNGDAQLCNPLPVDIYGSIDATKQYKPNFAPAPGSPAINGAVPVAIPVDPFFDVVNFIGAVDPNNDWTYGWTNLGAAKQLVSDINYSDTVDISDVIKINRISLGTDPVQGCSDANTDNAVDISDIVLTVRMSLGTDPTRTCCQE